MLIQFSIENHRSLRDETVFSFVASTALKDDTVHLLDGSAIGDPILPAAAIYGANASGKTNVLKGLSFMARAVLRSHRSWDPEHGVPRTPFRLDPTSSGNPSRFEVELLLGSIRYTYGFKVNDREVQEEWLHAYPKGRRQVWFTRTGNKFSFGKNFTGENRTIEALTRSNSLFLSTAAQNNHQLVASIYYWFSSELRFIDSENERERLNDAFKMTRSPEERDALMKLLRGADLGVSGIEVKDHGIFAENGKEEDFTTELRTIGELRKFVGDLEKPPTGQLIHQSRALPAGVPFPLDLESEGTRVLLSMAQVLHDTLESGSLLCVDELDRSLHPTMAVELVRLFSSAASNPYGAQLLFTTHNTLLLHRKVLRRDQIWLTEKDEMGATKLFPLTDFHPRNREDLEEGYLQGRYGGIPFLDFASYSEDWFPAKRKD